MVIENNIHNICVLKQAVVQHIPEKSMFRKTEDPTETVC